MNDYYERKRPVYGGGTRPLLWVLREGVPVPEDDQAAWSRWFHEASANEAAGRRVALDVVDGIRVSTVFLGQDMWMGDPDDERPVLFETMTFSDAADAADAAGERDGYQWRWHTWAGALAGHQRVVDALRHGRPLAHVTTTG